MALTTLAATKAVIQFIGLVVFSNQFSPGQDHLQALMPRISHAQTHEETARHRDGATERRSPNGTIEPHTAFIAFPTCDYISSKGWAPMGLETEPGYLYVKLDGERVEFKDAGTSIDDDSAHAVTNRSTHRARGMASIGAKAVPSEVAKASVDVSLHLPHIRPSCKSAPPMTLKTEFQPPFAGAVAVFDIRSGTVAACDATIKGSQSSRIDTRVEIANGGTLIISATKDGEEPKEIRLRGDAHVLVAHIPDDAITGVASTSGSAPHYMAYYQMMNTVDGACALDFHEAITDTDPHQQCWDDAALRMAATPPDGIFLRVDFECSNSQWP